MTAKSGLVLVLDDDARVCKSLSRMLMSSGYSVKSFRDPRELLASKVFQGPVCLVLDLKLARSNGFEVLSALKARERLPSVIFLTAHGDVRSAVHAMREGAVDFLEKPCEPEVLLASIAQAMSGARAQDQARQELMELESRAACLTPRERQVIKLVMCGLLNKEIAARLGLAEVTVKLHRGSAMRRLGAHNPAELARLGALLNLGPEGIRPNLQHPVESDA